MIPPARGRGIIVILISFIGFAILGRLNVVAVAVIGSFLQNVLWFREMKGGKNEQINSKTRARSDFRAYLEIGNFRLLRKRN